MPRPHLEPAIDKMKVYIIVSVYPHLSRGNIVTWHEIKEIMVKQGYPEFYRRLDIRARGNVLYEAMNQLGFERYSRKGQHSISAWVKPEVIRDV